jgi:hypothetical protein
MNLTSKQQKQLFALAVLAYRAVPNVPANTLPQDLQNIDSFLAHDVDGSLFEEIAEQAENGTPASKILEK